MSGFNVASASPLVCFLGVPSCLSSWAVEIARKRAWTSRWWVWGWKKVVVGPKRVGGTPGEVLENTKTIGKPQVSWMFGCFWCVSLEGTFLERCWCILFGWRVTCMSNFWFLVKNTSWWKVLMSKWAGETSEKDRSFGRYNLDSKVRGGLVQGAPINGLSVRPQNHRWGLKSLSSQHGLTKLDFLNSWIWPYRDEANGSVRTLQMQTDGKLPKTSQIDPESEKYWFLETILFFLG